MDFRPPLQTQLSIPLSLEDDAGEFGMRIVVSGVERRDF
jgi:hypothetical protein